jgi:hypothetical protein
LAQHQKKLFEAALAAAVGAEKDSERFQRDRPRVAPALKVPDVKMCEHGKKLTEFAAEVSQQPINSKKRLIVCGALGELLKGT